MTRTLKHFGAAVVLSTLALFGSATMSDDKEAVVHNYEVRMKNNKFDQSSIQVAVGDTVCWVNDDDDHHSVTTDGGNITKPEVIVEGGEHSARIKFDTAGEFKYKCKFHGGMAGTVNVGP